MAVELDYKSAIEEAFDVVKANLGPSLAVGVISIVPPLSLVAPLVVVNFLVAVKQARKSGRPIEYGDLFNTENLADKWVGTFLAGFAYTLCFFPGALFMFAPCILADRPGTPFVRALKAAFAFGKANLAGCLMLSVVCVVLILLAQVVCLLPVLFALPTAHAAIFIVYEEHHTEVEAAAAEAGVQLA
jgi:hypothetical protein